MLAIRMQRTGRKGHAMFRVVVQDAQRTPTSGKVVARIGSYDPHAKAVTLDKEKASFYLEHGAQPSGRVALLLKQEGVKLPDWVKLSTKSEGTVRNPDKRRSTRPAEPAAEEPIAEAALADTADTTADTEAAAEPEQAPSEATEAPAAEEAVTADADGSEEKAPDVAEEEAASPEAPAEAAPTSSDTNEKPSEADETKPAKSDTSADK